MTDPKNTVLLFGDSLSCEVRGRLDNIWDKDNVKKVEFKISPDPDVIIRHDVKEDEADNDGLLTFRTPFVETLELNTDPHIRFILAFRDFRNNETAIHEKFGNDSVKLENQEKRIKILEIANEGLRQELRREGNKKFIEENLMKELDYLFQKHLKPFDKDKK